MMLPTRLGLLLALLVGRTVALEWTNPTEQLTAVEGAQTVTAAFACRNTGAKPARIVSVLPSCDCLSAKPTNDIIAPGASAALRVEFALGGRAGRQEKTITVTTDDAPNKPTVLRLIVDIPELVAISPRFVFWRVGEPAMEKAIEITLADPENAKPDGVFCPEAAFAVRLESASGPNKFRLLIRPAGTATLVQAPIRLSATVDGQQRVYVLYAAVK